MERQLVFASQNQGKVAEVRAVLKQLNWTVYSMADVPELQELDIEETGDTFAANALLKAQACWKATGLPSVGDDSGLTIEALDGWPGVNSRRWLAGSDEERNQALLTKLTHQSNRQAAFVTVLCLVGLPGVAEPQYFTGELKGVLAEEVRGTAGFGYDPLFIPTGPENPQHQTLAELGLTVKNAISHRAQALQALAQYLQSQS